jgi:ribonuclease D
MAARAELGRLAETLHMPVENLVSPDSVRRVLWAPPGPDQAALADRLRELGARPWQVDLAAPVLVRSMAADVAPATTDAAVVTGE